MATKVGQAYVEITPKLGDMGKVNSDMGKGVKGEQVGAKAGQGIIGGIKSTAVGVALGGMLLKGVEAAVGGIKDLIGGAFTGFADYQQLAGGVEKIFDQADIQGILSDANNAYKELNMSANEYMAAVNQTGAAFAQTMGDQKGYDVARQGMLAISDYASGTGRDIQELNDKFSMITRSTSSYQSIADQFSGILPATSADFLEQAQAAGFLEESYTSLSEVPIDEYQQAVSAMLEKGVADMGLAGNTAAESAETVSGSLAMAKSAWENFKAALGNPEADIGEAFGVVAESIAAVAKNAIPVVAEIFMSLGEAIPMALSYVFTELPGQLLPMLEEAFATLGENATGPLADVFSGLGEVVDQLSPTFENVRGIADGVVQFIQGNMPMFAEIGAKIGEIAGIVGGILAEAINYISGVLAVIVPMILDIASAALPAVSGALDAVSGALTWLGEMFSGIISVLEVAIGWFAQIYEVVSPAIQMAFEAVGNALTSVGEFFTTAAQDAQADWQALKDWIAGLPAAIIGFFVNLPGSIQAKFNSAKAYAVAAFNEMKSTIAGIPDAIVNFFAGIGGKIADKVASVKEDVKAKFDEMVDAVAGIPDDIVSWFSGLGSRITDAIGSISFPKLSISWKSVSIGGKSISIPDVSWNAQGAFFDGATLIGAGEAGREALIPLENRRRMQPFADAVAEGIGRGEDAELLIDWLARHLGPIIADYAPTLTRRELDRMVGYA